MLTSALVSNNKGNNNINIEEDGIDNKFKNDDKSSNIISNDNRA